MLNLLLSILNCWFVVVVEIWSPQHRNPVDLFFAFILQSLNLQKHSIQFLSIIFRTFLYLSFCVCRSLPYLSVSSYFCSCCILRNVKTEHIASEVKAVCVCTFHMAKPTGCIIWQTVKVGLWGFFVCFVGLFLMLSFVFRNYIQMVLNCSSFVSLCPQCHRI